MDPVPQYFSDASITQGVKRAAKTAARFQRRGATDQVRDLRVTSQMEKAFYDVATALEDRRPYGVPRSFTRTHVVTAKRNLHPKGSGFRKDARWKAAKVDPHDFLIVSDEEFVPTLAAWLDFFSQVVLQTAKSGKADSRESLVKGRAGKKRARESARRGLTGYLVGANHRNLWRINPSHETFEVIAYAGGFAPPNMSA